MLRSAPRSSTRNTLVIAVLVLTAGILYSNFDPAPAGDDFSVTAVAPPAPVAVIPTVADTTDETVQSEVLATTTQLCSQKTELSQEFANIQECLDMLSAGQEFFSGVADYTVMFHKHERIDGDLQEPQTIQLKVQQKPHFSVYMKWQNFERGRQLLYSDQYDDGCIVVKFGGMKRFLPSVRLEPNGSLAMSESRYPATAAGVLGMIEQITNHREHDMKTKPKMVCTRTEVEFDGRPGVQFFFQYDDKTGNKTYRKSYLTIDKEYQVPVDVRNYTWSNQAEGLTDAQLDKQTLIEQYSFTQLNPTTQLADSDFSRENPRYRM